MSGPIAERDQQRRVAGHDPDLALGAARDDELGVVGDLDLSLGRDDLDGQRHSRQTPSTPSSRAFAITPSIPPTM